MSAQSPHRFQILALDGGGLKGIFSAAILAAIEEDLGEVLSDRFDLITGTSTGGLIALGLGAGLRPAELVSFYADNARRIFRGRRRLRAVRQVFRSKYRAAPLRDTLSDVFGERVLGESSKRLVIPTFNVGQDCVHIFKTPHHERLKRDWRVPIVDVALAATAAPTYFPAHIVQEMRLIDGGVWANNPSAVGVAEAVSMLGVPLDAVRVFSLGTTRDLTARASVLDRGGIAAWARKRAILDVILGGQSIAANNLTRHLVGDDRLLRINPDVPAAMFALDRVDAKQLLGMAAHHSRELRPRYEQLFAEHIASRYEPLHINLNERATEVEPT